MPATAVGAGTTRRGGPTRYRSVLAACAIGWSGGAAASAAPGSSTVAASALAGAALNHSTLDAAGSDAGQISQLFWIMAAVAVVVWLVVLGIALYASVLRPHPHSRRSSRWLVIGGGVVVPTVVLAALLLYGLVLMPQVREPVASHEGLRIEVSGEQWWWRVRYLPADGDAPVVSANEIRLPVGEPVQFSLSSPDVIHSFWIPALGGKLDMIPGRTTVLTLRPTRAGVFGGACAEYCGSAHAKMRFVAVAMEPDAFRRWLREQAAPAPAPAGAAARAGQQAFLANGCGACHSVRGTPADGAVGPDLTHVGSRLTLAAGTLPNDTAAFRHWIAETHQVKPGVLMPAFGMLPPRQLDAIALYLEGLQ